MLLNKNIVVSVLYTCMNKISSIKGYLFESQMKIFKLTFIIIETLN